MLKDAGIKLVVHSKYEMHLFDMRDTEEGYNEWQARLSEPMDSSPDQSA